MKIIKKLLSYTARRSYWYNNVVFQDCAKFWNIKEYQIDVVNLGSNSAKYGFDYSDCGVVGYNWAMGPQSLMMDLNILQCYYSYLKPGATVLIPLCPFSCMVGYDYSYFSDKYYTILNHAQIPFFNIHKRVLMDDIKRNPGKYIPLVEILKMIAEKVLFWRKKKDTTICDFEKDALVFINSWKGQFFIKDFDDEWSCNNMNSYKESQELLFQIVDFCKRYGFKPAVVMPPISPSLKQFFPEKRLNRYVVNYVKETIGENAIFLNYIDEEQFNNNDYFWNSYFLNNKGAKIFTKAVLRDLSIL